MSEQVIATTTEKHNIEIADGCLTINGEDKTLTPNETGQLFEVLLIWKYGLEEASSEELWESPLDDW